MCSAPSLQGPTLRQIVLPEDQSCPKPDANGHCHCTTRTGGDALHVTVQILGPYNQGFTAEVRLEGICSIYGSPEPPCLPRCIATLKFLHETDEVTIPPGLQSLSTSTVMPLEFNLVIPQRLASDTPSVDSRFLELYPSARVELSNGSWVPQQQSPRLSIFYRITATVKQDNALQYSYRPSQSYERNIRVTPTKLADPPLQMQFYPGEFNIESSTRVRSLCFSSIGKLHVSADEPRPLDLAVATPRTSTDVPILLSLTTAKPLAEPFQWTIVVRSRVQVRTFYSTQKLAREPTMRDLCGGSLYLKMASTKKETRYYKKLEWTKSQFPQNKGSIVVPDEMFGSLWFSTLYVTVSLSKDSLPSFLTVLAALRYSVVLKVSILGCTQSAARVEVPVQVYRGCQPVVGGHGLIPGIQEGAGTQSALYGGSNWINADLLEEPPPYRQQ